MPNRVTTKPIKVAPASAASPSISSPGSAWTFGSWVELIASAAADLYVCGIAIIVTAGTDDNLQLQLGTGSAGNEVGIHLIRLRVNLVSGVVGASHVVMFPIALGGFSAGDRISARLSDGDVSVETIRVALMYYEDLDSNNYVTASNPLTCAPLNGTAAITPSGAAWTDSNWTQLIASAAADIAIAGITFGDEYTGSVDAIQYEFDLGIGGAGSEVVITTTSGNTYDTGNDHMGIAWLQSPIPVAAGNRVAIRMRMNGTDTTPWPIAILYYNNLKLTGGGGAGKGNSNNGKKGGGGGLNVLNPGGASVMNIGNAGIDIGVAG